MISIEAVNAALVKELGQLNSTQAHSTASILRNINSWVRWISLARDFSFNRKKISVTIPANTETNIPYQIQTFFVKSADTGKNLELLDFDQYYWADYVQTNQIGIWENVIISPAAGEYTIIYRGLPDAIFSLTNTSVNMPDHFFDLLVSASLHYAFKDQRNYDKANIQMSVMKWLIQDIAARDTNRRPRSDMRMSSNYIM